MSRAHGVQPILLLSVTQGKSNLPLSLSFYSRSWDEGTVLPPSMLASSTLTPTHQQSLQQ